MTAGLLLQAAVGKQQPGCFAEANAVHVEQLRAVLRAAVKVRCGVDRDVAGVLEGQRWLDLLRLLRRGGKEDEVDIVATRRLCIDGATHGGLQALRACFALAQLQQLGNLSCQLDGLIDVLHAKQLPALCLPATLEGGQHAAAPFAARHQRYGAAHAVIPGALRGCACLVLGSQAKLEELGRRRARAVAVVQGQRGQGQLLAFAELLDQRFFQRADDQLDTVLAGLLVESVQRADAVAVIQLHAG